MPRKQRSFQQLFDYINAPEQKGVAWLFNLRTEQDDRSTITDEFLANARLLPQRKNGNLLYHEIVSFHQDDQSQLSADQLQDLCREYLQRRAPYNLVYAKAHYDTAHPHIHLMISANAVASKQRLRLSKQQFNHIRRDLERWQQMRYPALQHSVAYNQDRQPPASQQEEHLASVAPRACSRAEQERTRRLAQSTSAAKRPSLKDQLGQLVRDTLASVHSHEALLVRLAQQGWHLYQRGTGYGIESNTTGKRYRLSSLGVMTDLNQAWYAWRLSHQQRHSRDQHPVGCQVEADLSSVSHDLQRELRLDTDIEQQNH